MCKDYTNSGHADLLSICVLCTEYIHKSIQYTYVSTLYIYLFLMQYFKRFISVVLGMVHSDSTVVVLLHTRGLFRK